MTTTNAGGSARTLPKEQRASVIMASPVTGHNNRPPSATTGGMSDPVIDEHFRRSLGKDYINVFAPTVTQREPREQQRQRQQQQQTDGGDAGLSGTYTFVVDYSYFLYITRCSDIRLFRIDRGSIKIVPLAVHITAVYARPTTISGRRPETYSSTGNHDNVVRRLNVQSNLPDNVPESIALRAQLPIEYRRAIDRPRTAQRRL